LTEGAAEDVLAPDVVHYRITDGRLAILDDTGEALWSGEPLGHAAQEVLAIDGSEDCVVLCSYGTGVEGRPFSNVARLTSYSSIVWQAELPEPNDSYVALRCWSFRRSAAVA
jgi:hypothetical protein